MWTVTVLLAVIILTRAGTAAITSINIVAITTTTIESVKGLGSCIRPTGGAGCRTIDQKGSLVVRSGRTGMAGDTFRGRKRKIQGRMRWNFVMLKK